MYCRNLLVAFGATTLVCALGNGVCAQTITDAPPSTTQQAAPQPDSQQQTAGQPNGPSVDAAQAQNVVNNSPQSSPVVQIKGSRNFLESPAKLSDQVLQTFRNDPPGLLSRNPDGGLLLTSETRGLVGSDVELVNIVIGLAKEVSAKQLSSIAAGLAQIVRASAPTRPDIALYIQQQIVLANNPALLAAFNASLGDVQTAAFGAAVSGPAAAAGGIGGGGNASGTSALSVGVAGAGAPSISRSSSTPGFFSSVTTTITTLSITSVSPTRP